jgi:ABC-2 type transport system ATP-binding protein
METILEIKGLSKHYGSRCVLGGLDFTVAAGQVCALLGPNGAGKTTCLEIIEGLRPADAGSVHVAGIDALRHPAKAMATMGVQLQVQGLPASMTVAESVAFVCRCRGVRADNVLLANFGLDQRKKEQFKNLSIGWQRRLVLALALMGNPALLILDEPTAGLDVESRAVLHKAIQDARARGSAILLATHDMAEAEKLADQVLVLLEGQIVSQGTPRQLTSQSQVPSQILLQTRQSLDGTLPAWLAAYPASLDPDAYCRLASSDPATDLVKIMADLSRSNDRLLDLRVQRPSLEDSFLHLAQTKQGVQS